MHLSACIEWQFAKDYDTLTGSCVDPRRSMIDTAQHEELPQAVADTHAIARCSGALGLEYRPTLEVAPPLAASRVALDA
jgi:hypothetical protein